MARRRFVTTRRCTCRSTGRRSRPVRARSTSTTRPIASRPWIQSTRARPAQLTTSHHRYRDFQHVPDHHYGQSGRDLSASGCAELQPDLLCHGGSGHLRRHQWRVLCGHHRHQRVGVHHQADGPANPNNVVVAADGSGDFCTVQGAVDSLPGRQRHAHAGQYSQRHLHGNR